MLFEEIYDSVLFEYLDKKYVQKLLKKSGLAELKAGQFLFHQGIIGRGIYFMLNGSVNIVLEVPEDSSKKEVNEIIFSNHKPYSFFGEICFLQERPRVASAKAVEDSEVLYLDNEVLFQGLYEKNINAFQLGLNVGKVMATHIQDLNQKLIALNRESGPDYKNIFELKL